MTATLVSLEIKSSQSRKNRKPTSQSYSQSQLLSQNDKWKAKHNLGPKFKRCSRTKGGIGQGDKEGKEMREEDNVKIQARERELEVSYPESNHGAQMGEHLVDNQWDRHV